MTQARAFNKNNILPSFSLCGVEVLWLVVFFIRWN
jgi:hypothetical protein